MKMKQFSNPGNRSRGASRRNFLKLIGVGAAAASLGFPALLKAQGNTIKIGVLHSLSGTMAISETVLKDVTLMAIEEINAKGGVLGKKLEPVVVDPASNWPLFAEKSRQLLTQDKVAVVFGCWTSVSRKSVLPVFEELNGLLFYPVQYEGEELSKNVFYTGAAPNQQAIPAVEYLMSKDGGGAKRFVLLGTDYVYPRTTNKILRAFLKSKNIPEADILEEYTPFGHSAQWKIPAAQALVAYLWAWMENQVMAAVKLVPLGQTEGQRILLRLGEGLAEVAERASSTGDNELGSFAPRLAILSSAHETQYSRLFRS